LDSLAADGIKFERAYSPAPWTVPVHGSLFSGQLPSHNGTHRKSKLFKKSADKSLAGTLSGAGYQTAGFSANPWLSSELQFNTGFDHFESLSGAPPFPDEPTAPETPVGELYSTDGMRNVLRWISDGNPFKRFVNGVWKRYLDTGAGVNRINESIIEWVNNQEDEQMFVFANYMDVHDPHYDDFLSWSNLDLPPASKRINTNKSRCQAAYSKQVDFMSEPEDPERASHLYDSAIRQVDEGLRDLFDELEGMIDFDESLVVILGDHGESLGENNYWGHGTYIHEALIRVPLIISPPEGDLSIDSNQPISLIDITEYITNITDTSMGEENDDTNESSSGGKPIFAETIGPRLNMEEPSLQDGFEAVILDEYKLVRNRATGDTELTSIDDQDEQTEDNQKRLEALLDKQRSDVSQQNAAEGEEAISEEMRSRLSDLGYL
jgi:arylsulfatase A-like enzyme